MDSFIRLFQVVKEMAWSAGIVIVVVLLCRSLLQKVSKTFCYALWLVVAIRLVCPVMLPAQFSLFGILPQVDASFFAQNTEKQNLEIENAANAAASSQSETKTENVGLTKSDAKYIGNEYDTQNTMPLLKTSTSYGAVFWLIGMLAFFVYGMASYILLSNKLKFATRNEEGFYESDRILSPFVFGVMRPQIYLPYHMLPEERDYILAHERYHIKRKDYIIKLVAYGLLCIYWFWPPVWAACFFMSKDMEMSCDEHVLVNRSEAEKKEYANLLLGFVTKPRLHILEPLSFGENSIKQRVKRVLNYKKPAFWGTIFAVLLLFVVGTVCLTDANNSEKQKAQTATAATLLYENKNPYVGDVSADGQLLQAINEVVGDIKVEGTITTQLQTIREPYSYILHFVPVEQDEAVWEEQSQALDTEMWKRAALMLALIENCGTVQWDYYVSGSLITYSVSTDDVNGILGISDIKGYADSTEKVAELLQLLDISEQEHISKKVFMSVDAISRNFEDAYQKWEKGEMTDSDFYMTQIYSDMLGVYYGELHQTEAIERLNAYLSTGENESHVVSISEEESHARFFEFMRNTNAGERDWLILIDGTSSEEGGIYYGYVCYDGNSYYCPGYIPAGEVWNHNLKMTSGHYDYLYASDRTENGTTLRGYILTDNPKVTYEQISKLMLSSANDANTLGDWAFLFAEEVTE